MPDIIRTGWGQSGVHYLRRDKSRAGQAAFNTVWNLVRDDPEQAWRFVLRAVTLARNDNDLAYLAAGPLEDLLKLHGDEFFGRVEEEARRNEKMLCALSGVWLNKGTPTFARSYAIMEKYGFVSGGRQAL